MIKYGYTIMYVENVQKSIEFYEKSFGFKRKFITPEFDYGELNTAETTISFASKELALSNLKEGFEQSDLSKKPFGLEIGFVTDEVENYLKKAKENGGVIVEEPKRKPWGQLVSFIRDLDGFLIEICSPMN